MKLQYSNEKISQETVDQASRWFVEFRLGDADAKSREQFNAWLRASPIHIRAYLEVSATYAGLAPRGSDLKFDVDKLIQSARADENVILLGNDSNHDQRWVGRRQGPGRVRSRFVPFAVAATLLVVLSGIYTWHEYDRQIYSTRIGEQRSLSLADGSQISLNARSEVRVRFGKGERRVDLLQGQALFQVAKDSRRPFAVHIEDVVVRAIGTRFDVERQVFGTTVTVLEGRVAVIADRSPSHALPELIAGEQVTVSANVARKAKKADISAATAWTQRKLVFEGTPLAEVVEDFNRYNTRQLVIADRSLDNFRVSGIYASPDPASLLNFLRTEPGIEVTEDPDGVRIARK